MRRAALVAVVASSVALTQSTVAVAQVSSISRIVLGIGADETEANVAWQSRTSGAQYLEYWPTDNPGAVTTIPAQQGAYNAAVFYPQEATMTGLATNTSYTYRISDGQGAHTAEHTFRTDDFDDSWNFLALADAQIGVALKVAEQTANWDKALETATAEHPNSSFIMHLGDQVEGWGDPVAQYEGFLSPDEVRSYRLGVLKGNHETYGVTPAKHFDDAFALPNEVGNSANYFFEYNNVLFIGLDSNRNTSSDIAEHIDYVNDIIGQHGAGADWIIVGFHHALFSQGTHYTDAEVMRLREQLAPALSAAGVDLVLNGHDHIYTRTHLMEGTNPVAPAEPARAGDVLYPTEGQVLYVTSTTAGGGKYYDFQGNDGGIYPRIREERARDIAHPSTARWRQDYNPDYTNVEVTADSLTLTTYNVNTPYVVDKVTLSKGSTKVEEPDKQEKPDTPKPPVQPGEQPDPSGTNDTDNTAPGSSGSSEGGVAAAAGLGVVGVLLALIVWGVNNSGHDLASWLRNHLPF